MKPNHVSTTRIIALALAAIMALQLALTPIAFGAAVYNWYCATTGTGTDASPVGTCQFYNADTGKIQNTRPSLSESGGTIWTDLLQNGAAATTLATKTNLKVCMLLPVTGSLGPLGVDEREMAHIAVLQANTILAAGATGVTFADPNTYAYDTATSPSTAFTAWQSAYAAGCRVTIGAAGSGETSGFLGEANASAVPTISPSSTAASLAGAYPGILFRTPGNDLVQAPANAALDYNVLGLRHIAIITRNDPYGTGIRDGIKAAFEALGGTVADPTVTTYDYTSASAIQSATDTLNGQVHTLLGSFPAKTVGVVIIAFAIDGVTILEKARTESDLGKVQWVGTDGIAGDISFVPNPPAGATGGTGTVDVGAFMVKTNVTGETPTSPLLGTGGAQMELLALNGTTVNKKGGGTIDLTHYGWYGSLGGAMTRSPQPYWDYSYDAAVIAMLAVLNETGTTYSGPAISAQIGKVANATIGATGLLTLASTGDRAKQDYIIYGYTGPAPITTTTPALPNAILSIALIFLAATVTVTIARKKRI